MTPYDLVDALNLVSDSYVFEIAMRYECESKWDVVTSYYDVNDFDPNVWEWDWWEGQQNVKLLRYCSLRDVFHPEKWVELDIVWKAGDTK